MSLIRRILRKIKKITDRLLRLYNWNLGYYLKKNLSMFHSKYQDWVCGAIFSKDESEVLSAGPESGGACIWDVATQKIRHRFGKSEARLGRDESHKDTVVSAYFSPREDFVITASEDSYAFIWSVKSRTVVIRLPHPAKVLVAHFSPDGSQALTACDDGCVYLWSISLN